MPPRRRSLRVRPVDLDHGPKERRRAPLEFFCPSISLPGLPLIVVSYLVDIQGVRTVPPVWADLRIRAPEQLPCLGIDQDGFTVFVKPAVRCSAAFTDP